MKYKQCNFCQGDSRTTAWIPAWAAKSGNSVQLKTHDNPESFWWIESVGDMELDESAIRSQERNYKEFQGSTRGGGID